MANEQAANNAKKKRKINFYKFVGKVEEKKGVLFSVGNNKVLTAVNGVGAGVNAIARELQEYTSLAASNFLKQQKIAKDEKKTQQEAPKKEGKKRGGAGFIAGTVGALAVGGLTAFIQLFGGIFKKLILLPVLNWISKPENKKKLESIVGALAEVGKFLFAIVEGAVFTTLELIAGFTKLPFWKEILNFGLFMAALGTSFLAFKKLFGGKAIKWVVKSVFGLFKGFFKAMTQFAGRLAARVAKGAFKGLKGLGGKRGLGKALTAAAITTGTGIALSAGADAMMSSGEDEEEGQALKELDSLFQDQESQDQAEAEAQLAKLSEDVAKASALMDAAEDPSAKEKSTPSPTGGVQPATEGPPTKTGGVQPAQPPTAPGAPPRASAGQPDSPAPAAPSKPASPAPMASLGGMLRKRAEGGSTPKPVAQKPKMQKPSASAGPKKPKAAKFKPLSDLPKYIGKFAPVIDPKAYKKQAKLLPKLFQLPMKVVGLGVLGAISNVTKILAKVPGGGLLVGVMEGLVVPIASAFGLKSNVTSKLKGAGLAEAKQLDKKQQQKQKSEQKQQQLEQQKDIEKAKESGGEGVGGVLGKVAGAAKGAFEGIKGFFGLSKKAGGGWIQGPQTGYPVSLDGGKSVSFIGHGTEYVATKSGGGNAFVIPYDTPATRGNKNLTGRREKEASSAGFKFAAGGALLKAATGAQISGDKVKDGKEKNDGDKTNTKGAKVLSVPYFNQRQNKTDGLGTSGDSQCFSTSAAMVVSAVSGKTVTPDEYNKVRQKYGLSTAMGAHPPAMKNFGVPASGGDNGSYRAYKSAIDAGKPVILGLQHNSGSGHMVAGIGYKGNDIVVNDPWGRLNPTPKGGWASTNLSGEKDTKGAGVVYPKSLMDGIWVDRGPGTGRMLAPTKGGVGSGPIPAGGTSDGDSGGGGGDDTKKEKQKPKTRYEKALEFLSGIGDAASAPSLFSDENPGMDFSGAAPEAPGDTPKTPVETAKKALGGLIGFARGGRFRDPNSAKREEEQREKMFSGDGRRPIGEYAEGGEVSDSAQAIIAGAKKTIGAKRGVSDMCAFTTRLALANAGHPYANKTTGKGDLDTPKGTGYSGRNFAASFGGTDMGTIIRDRSKIKAGDIILWREYSGNRYGKGAITHVGIAADDGLRNQYDHNTSKGFQYRPHWDKFGGTEWFAGVRLGGKATGDPGDPDKTGGDTPGGDKSSPPKTQEQQNKDKIKGFLDSLPEDSALGAAAKSLFDDSDRYGGLNSDGSKPAPPPPANTPKKKGEAIDAKSATPAANVTPSSATPQAQATEASSTPIKLDPSTIKAVQPGEKHSVDPLKNGNQTATTQSSGVKGSTENLGKLKNKKKEDQNVASMKLVQQTKVNNASAAQQMAFAQKTASGGGQGPANTIDIPVGGGKEEEEDMVLYAPGFGLFAVGV
jgi:hypothetical protein